ncbi:MAG TPA: endolytic transglycosylase MltG [Steroidobacteraceae bacterium]
MSNRRPRVLGILVLVLLGCAVGAAGVWLRLQFYAPGPSAATVRIQVEQGASVRTVLGQLAQTGVLRDPRGIELYRRLWGRVHAHPLRIQAGTYEITPHASPAQILELFDQGRVVLEQLTIIEGSTFADLRRTLAAHPALTHTLRGKSDAEVMSALGHPGQFPEGLFFPDTYRFAAKTTDLEILGLAYASLQRILDAAWQQRAANLPLQNAYEALTLASIVEKETALPSERARIAGVFVSRLRKGMRLQTDPTVIYGLGAGYDGEIHTRDLVTDTPYNTYTRGGLPPTPICLPGRDSILAAVHPQENGELYFVATGTGDGAHHFSSTLEEHNAAVKSYLQHMRLQQHVPANAPNAPNALAPHAQTGTAPHALPGPRTK